MLSKAMRQMILAADKAERQSALNKLLAMQREDITELFKIMDGLPVTVRLLDPPLHELLSLQCSTYPHSPLNGIPHH